MDDKTTSRTLTQSMEREHEMEDIKQETDNPAGSEDRKIAYLSFYFLLSITRSSNDVRFQEIGEACINR